MVSVLLGALGGFGVAKFAKLKQPSGEHGNDMLNEKLKHNR